jgi:hypothetical protein
MIRKDCLDRQTFRAVAAGRCPKERLAAVQRHLARCSRCRAAVVAAAAGVRGPGETVVLKRPSRGSRRCCWSWPRLRPLALRGGTP